MCVFMGVRIYTRHTEAKRFPLYPSPLPSTSPPPPLPLPLLLSPFPSPLPSPSRPPVALLALRPLSRHVRRHLGPTALALATQLPHQRQQPPAEGGYIHD